MITPLFYPGQKVVCVRDDFTILLANDPTLTVPVKDKVYTVRKNLQLLHDVGIHLVEIDNSHAIPKGRKIEVNFSQSRFAPVPPTLTVSNTEEVVEELAEAA